MLAYVKALINIAFRKLGPEDLPHSKFLLGLTVTIYLLVQIPLAWIVFGASKILLQTIVLDITMLVGCLWVLLRLTGYQSRFHQTLTAILGTSTLLGILSAPFSFWRQFIVAPEASVALPSTIIFAIMLWSLTVDGHIISRALSRSYGIGLMAAVVYFVLHTMILLELIPVGATS